MDSIRCSGEMNTSLGNTLLNYISIMVAAELQGQSCECVVEGDDALISIPDTADHEQYTRDMRSLGFNVKLDVVPCPGKAGYCSMKWDANGTVIPDPSSFVADFFWTRESSLSTITREDLLAAKCLSYMAMCPDMPVMWKIYEKYAKKSFKAQLNQYEIEEYANFSTITVGETEYQIDHEVGPFEPLEETRHLFADLYQMPVYAQLIVERLIDANMLQEALEDFYAIVCPSGKARLRYEEGVDPFASRG